MTWRAVAARDARGARRSVGLWLVAGLPTPLLAGVVPWGGAVAGRPASSPTRTWASSPSSS